MPLDERDYMQRRRPTPWWRRLSPGAVLGALLAVAAAVGAIAELASNASFLAEFLPSREGTLIVNINTATKGELETLPGIGPALATLIAEGRPYRTIEDLERVDGIGPGKMRSLRPLVVVDGETRRR